MIPGLQNKIRPAHRGFTLVELLVVILIIAVLPAMMLSITLRVVESAKASNRLANVRQAGSVLLAIASENNGRCSFYAGGRQGWEYRPYLILLKELSLTNQKNYKINEVNRVEIMHWDMEKLPSPLPHWNCHGINYQNVTYPDGTTAKWTHESVKNVDGTTASTFLFDGSACHMSKADLKKADFTKAYDNSTVSPKSVTL